MRNSNNVDLPWHIVLWFALLIVVIGIPEMIVQKIKDWWNNG